MRIKDVLAPQSILLNASVSNKDEAIERLVDLMAAGGKLSDKDTYKNGVYAREQEATTAVGDGVAIPHCRSAAVTQAGLAAMTVPAGVDFDAPDNEKVTLFFLIAAPEKGGNVHVEVLSKLSTLLLDDLLVETLRAAKTVDEFIAAIDRAETEKDAAESAQHPNAAPTALAAVTACPTGIAHTYIAAEKLQKVAAELGCVIKVETRGSSGAKNVLTESDIAQAACIIVAADTQVPLDRFHGKKLIQCRVGDGINKAEELIRKAKEGQAPVYQAAQKSTEFEAAGSGMILHNTYKHLMNGVSYMLPFVVGGGILIAIAFLIDSFSLDINALPLEQRSAFGSLTPAAALFMKIGGGSFSFMLPLLAGFIALSIADRSGLAAGFIGGYFAAQGKSGFLGALAAGFAAGYLMLLVKKICTKLPKSFEGVKPILIFPLAGILGTGIIMLFMIEPPIGAINTALNTILAGMTGTRGVILGLILGGMMSADMGGPINKAAYVFGTASIAAGNYPIMAAVMVGGMVPPIAIAVSSMLFKHKYTEEERKAAPTNIIMGLSFITEGAIPFAAADPLRVIPCCIIGSAIAGGISMAAQCSLMAPHGGIFVFPVVGNAFMYLAALVAGSLTAAVLLGAVKKTVVR